MNRVLFVSNGHGEIAIAARIARELAGHDAIACDHLALVGDVEHGTSMRDVGPRRSMPSGGVIAMGNLTNIVRDVRAGLLQHTFAQLRFLRAVRATYAVAVAVGDVFALLMARTARAGATVFVGTAKSVYVAPYGPFEELVVRRADAVFVRDPATAQRLASHGIRAQAGNVIADLYAPQDGDSAPEVPFDPLLAVFPGSREGAYDDALFLAQVVRGVTAREPRAGAILSIAPGIDAARLRAAFADAGWRIADNADPLQPFSLFENDREIARTWRGPLGAMLRHARLVLGQAGTANESAAAHGIPVVAFARPVDRATPWYRMRQIGLLGDAMLLVDGDAQQAAQEVWSLLHDPDRAARMGTAGRERMGEPGAASRIARAIAAAAQVQPA